jgi:hypothetical protein
MDESPIPELEVVDLYIHFDRKFLVLSLGILMPLHCE